MLILVRLLKKKKDCEFSGALIKYQIYVHMHYIGELQRKREISLCISILKKMYIVSNIREGNNQLYNQLLLSKEKMT